MSRLLNKYEGLQGVEFHINEWGMSSHFQKTVADYPDLVYRNSEESALFLVKLVDCPTSMLLYRGGAWKRLQNYPQQILPGRRAQAAQWH